MDAILFDFDGTLLDSMGPKSRLAVEIFGRYLVLRDPELARQRFLETSGQPFIVQTRLLFPEVGEPIRERITEEYHMLVRGLKPHLKVFEEVPQVLGELHKKYSLAISSSSRSDELNYWVDQYGLRPYFAAVLGTDGEFHKGKPHIEFIRQQFNPAKIYVVGDSPADMAAAVAAGAIPIGRAGTVPETALRKAGALHTIKDLTGLFRILE